jgi:hypothetical protein
MMEIIFWIWETASHHIEHSTTKTINYPQNIADECNANAPTNTTKFPDIHHETTQSFTLLTYLFIMVPRSCNINRRTTFAKNSAIRRRLASSRSWILIGINSGSRPSNFCSMSDRSRMSYLEIRRTRRGVELRWDRRHRYRIPWLRGRLKTKQLTRDFLTVISFPSQRVMSIGTSSAICSAPHY